MIVCFFRETLKLACFVILTTTTRFRVWRLRRSLQSSQTSEKPALTSASLFMFVSWKFPFCFKVHSDGSWSCEEESWAYSVTGVAHAVCFNHALLTGILNSTTLCNFHLYNILTYAVVALMIYDQSLHFISTRPVFSYAHSLARFSFAFRRARVLLPS